MPKGSSTGRKPVLGARAQPKTAPKPKPDVAEGTRVVEKPGTSLAWLSIAPRIAELINELSMEFMDAATVATEHERAMALLFAMAEHPANKRLPIRVFFRRGRSIVLNGEYDVRPGNQVRDGLIVVIGKSYPLTKVIRADLLSPKV